MAPTPRRLQLLSHLERRYHLPRGILYGQWGAETGFAEDGDSQSGAGAVGPLQFLPSTAAGMGVNPRKFASAAKGAARYDAQYTDRGFAGILAAYNAGPAGNPNNPETQGYIKRVRDYAGQAPYEGGTTNASALASGMPRAQLRTRNVLDQQGFDEAQRRYELGQLLKNARSPFQDFGPRAGVDSPNPLLQVLPHEAPLPEEYTRAVTSLKRLAGGLTVGAPNGGGKLPRGVARFEGAPVAAWIAPILAYARQQGWRGAVTSGFRSYADQKRIYDSGVRPAAKPGTSNHEGDVFPRGAVDVSDAQTLARIIARSPYRGRLVWAGTKDPVHFSHPHNGGY
jgi:hypothetical protein